MAKCGPSLRTARYEGFLLFVVVIAVVLSLERSIAEHETVFESLTDSTFNVISIITTTGFASEDYTAWGNFAVMVFFYVTFVGGCSGSTPGAIKHLSFSNWPHDATQPIAADAPYSRGVYQHL